MPCHFQEYHYTWLNVLVAVCKVLRDNSAGATRRLIRVFLIARGLPQAETIRAGSWA
jgi:hypothetical protein